MYLFFFNKKAVGEFPTTNIFSQKEQRSYLQDVGGGGGGVGGGFTTCGIKLMSLTNEKK
jgi:hypothetical protein